MAASVRVGDRPEPRFGGIVGAALLAALLFSVCVVVPILWLVGIVAPLPLIVLRLRGGLGSATMGTLLAVAVIAWAFTPKLGLYFLLPLALPALLIGEAMARGRGLRRGCGWAFFTLAFEIAAMLLFAGPRVSATLLEPFDAFRSPEFLAEMRTRLPQDDVDAWAERATRLYNAMEVVYPAAFVILAALIVLANAALLRAYLARRDPGWLEGGEFEGIRWPFALAVLFVLGGLAVAFPPLRPAGYNVLLVVAFFFAIQGLAVVAYYAHRLAGPLLFRAGLLALVLLNPWAPQILALVGLFDTWADFRRWADPPEPEQG